MNTNHFPVRELYKGSRLILSTGTYIVTDVEQSDVIPENVFVHLVGGMFECAASTEFVSVKPGTFKVVQ